MTKKQKADFIKHVRNFVDGHEAADIEWLAFVMKTNECRITLASEKAPKSTRLCDR